MLDKNNKKQVNFKVDAALYKQARINLLKEGKTISKFLVEALKAYVQKT